MYLSRLYIENYRSIQKLDLKFEPGKNVIVGRNNSGKSNILKAIDLVLGEYSPTYSKTENVTENDFHCGKTDEPIFIWCELTRNVLPDNSLEKIDFTDVEKTAFFRVYLDKYLNEEIRISTTNFPQAEKEKIFEFCSEDGQMKIDSNQFGKKWIGGKQYCKSSFRTEFSDKARFAIAFLCKKNDTKKLEKDLVILYRENEQVEWIQGINCNIRNILLQSAVIPAFRDPKDQLRINSYSWFGKLLKAYVKSDNEDLQNAFASVKSASDEMFKELKTKVTDKEIDVAFPNTTISFQFNPDTKQDIHKSTLIYVDDGFNSELKDKGAGIQSAVTISLYDFYIKNVAHSGSSLLGVEEPELYLHPHGRRVISDRLSRFASNGKNQVILTTHTPEFISNISESQNIIAVKKNNTATEARNIRFDTPKRKQILIKKQNAELFFADTVILTEGAEKYFIEEAAKEYALKAKFLTPDGKLVTLNENWLNEYNISIVNCSGKAELWKYVEILKELHISFITTADFDFLRDGLSNYLTQLRFEQDLCDDLNALKSQIAGEVSGKYKNIGELPDELQINVRAFFQNMLQHSVFVFTGELENFYLQSPAFTKEAGVVETMGKVIEQQKPLSEYVDVTEYFNLFEVFIEKFLNLKRLINEEEVLRPVISLSATPGVANAD
ncbi:ATP-dependent nuclease [Flavisolibacter nicotianae]|uniref:ATP-dependent nuclease n=1 Tax=Flavisolibacter nicotianae TaxID=2364882 RepID=UPI000EAC550B|nr:AAA family ATPase [Flavisolibacter nicotianae]